MPRTRRRMAKTPRRRERADWVYLGNIHDEAGTLVWAAGTYDAVDFPLLPASGNAVGKILYHSYNFIHHGTTMASPGTLLALPRYSRAEGRNAKIRRVRGMVHIHPSTWAIGSTFRIGFRFGIFEQDAESGFVLIDPLYNMWTNSGNDDVNPQRWANDRNWQHEWRDTRTFSDNSSFFNYRFDFPVNRTLKPHECYAMYVESASTSVNLVGQSFLRTLVVDEG